MTRDVEFWLQGIAKSLEKIAAAQEERNELLVQTNELSERQEDRLDKLAEIQFSLYADVEAEKERRQVSVTLEIPQGDEHGSESQV